MADEMNQDGENLNPDEANNESGDELDSILGALSAGESDADKKADPTPVDGRKEDGSYYKKVGNIEFKNLAEFETWALKNYGTLSNTVGELERLKKENSKTEMSPKKDNTQTKTDVDVNALRWQIKVDDFFEQYPAAEGYREEMAAFLRTGKANNEKGKPDLRIAYVKALRADGKEVPTVKESSSDSLTNNQKRIMRSGGRDSGVGTSNYVDESDTKAIDDFANFSIKGGR